MRNRVGMVLIVAACCGACGPGGRGPGEPCGPGAPCRVGLECENDDGTTICRDHRGTDSPALCVTDAECPEGLECEWEQDAGTCQPHGAL